MSNLQFEPITLTGCDEDRVKKNGSQCFLVPFSLSSKPPREWQDRFQKLWDARSGQQRKQRAKAFFKKKEVVLVSPLSDIGLHFANLNSDIDVANKEYVKFLQKKNGKKSVKKRRKEEKQAEERRAIREAVGGLSFPTPEAIPD